QERAELDLATAEPEHARTVMLQRRDQVWANAAAVVTLGRACEAAGDDAGAVAAFQRALALDSKSDAALYRLGRLYLRQGKTDPARDAFFHAMFLDQGRPEYPFSAGMAYLRQAKPGDRQRPARPFNDTPVLRPRYSPAHYQ